MADSFKNIVITPNIANSADPKIVFNGANATVNATISLFMYPASNGTLSFEGTAGQLFSITNDLSNSIFSASDISGIPALEAFANGQNNIAPVYGNVSIGSNSIDRSIRMTNRVIVGNEPTSFDYSPTSPVQIQDNSNTFSEVVISNKSAGTRASGDFTITDNLGNSVQGFLNLGINGSGFSDATFTVAGAREAYLYSQNSSFAIGTADPADKVSVFVGSTLANSSRLEVNTSTVKVMANSLTLGISSIVANNGYTRLPNGLLMQWGNSLANTTATNITFTVPFSTIYQASATSGLTGFYAYVAGQNTTVLQLRSSQAVAATNRCMWIAIGI